MSWLTSGLLCFSSIDKSAVEEFQVMGNRCEMPVEIYGAGGTAEQENLVYHSDYSTAGPSGNEAGAAQDP